MHLSLFQALCHRVRQLPQCVYCHYKTLDVHRLYLFLLQLHAQTPKKFLHYRVSGLCEGEKSPPNKSHIHGFGQRRSEERRVGEESISRRLRECKNNEKNSRSDRL